MSEAALAQDYCFQIALPEKSRGGGVKEQLNYVYGVLRKRNAPEKNWTWRRVRALWNGEVPDRAVRAWELSQLEEAAALLERAREAHAKYIEETERMAAAFAAQDEDFYRPEIEARRGILGGAHRAGTGGGQ